MTSDIQAGSFAMLDHVLKVRVIRLLPDGKAIIAVGSDTTTVEASNLTTIE